MIDCDPGFILIKIQFVNVCETEIAWLTPECDVPPVDPDPDPVDPDPVDPDPVDPDPVDPEPVDPEPVEPDNNSTDEDQDVRQLPILDPFKVYEVTQGS